MITTSPSVTIGPETRVIIVKPPFSFFTLRTPAAGAPDSDSFNGLSGSSGRGRLIPGSSWWYKFASG
jgi:hypothetical protein